MQLLSQPLNYDGESIKTITARAGVFINGNTIKILEEMFTFHDGRQTRKNTTFLKALSIALQHSEYPTYDNVWDCTGREYAETTKKQNKSWISRSGWLDDGVFGTCQHF